MPTKAKMSQEEAEFVVKDYTDKKMMLKELVKKYGRKPGTIRKLLKERGIKIEYNRNRQVDPALKDKAVELRQQGKTNAEIAEQLGISHGTVNNFLIEKLGRELPIVRSKRIRAKEYTQEELLQILKDYYDEYNVIPTTTLATKCKQLPSPITYNKYFPNTPWPRILEKVGLDISRYYMANDGHIYDSSFEVEIANKLLEQNIKYEPHKRICKDRRWTCDFHLLDQGLWLEFDGLEDMRRNKEELAEKLEYYKTNNYNHRVMTKDEDLMDIIKQKTP